MRCKSSQSGHFVQQKQIVQLTGDVLRTSPGNLIYSRVARLRRFHKTNANVCRSSLYIVVLVSTVTG